MCQSCFGQAISKCLPMFKGIVHVFIVVHGICISRSHKLRFYIGGARKDCGEIVDYLSQNKSIIYLSIQ